VLPSSYGEGLPKSLLEAAASGKAMVTTDIPGCRSVVRNNETGLLVAPKNIRQLADAIETLINDKELRLRMGKRARELVECEFSEKIINAKIMNLYQQLLGNLS